MGTDLRKNFLDPTLKGISLFRKIKLKISTRLLLILTFSIYLVFSLIRISYHEMWRDELQAWMIASASHSVFELFHNLHFENHPGLWHLILFGLQKFSSNPLIMQFTHVIIASTSALVILFFSPFKFPEKLAIIFSYALFFEYNVIARSYSLGVLFFFLATLELHKRQKMSLWGAVSIFLLSQTSIYGGILGGSLALSFLCREKHLNRQNRRFYFIVLIGIGLLFLQIIRKDQLTTGWTLNLNMIDAWLNGIFPVTPIVRNFWNQNWLFQFHLVKLLLGYGLAVIVIFWITRISTREAKSFFVFSTSTLFLFFTFKFYGFTRHHEHLFLTLIGTLWLSRSPQATPEGLRTQTVLFSSIFAAQLWSSAAATYLDLQYPFSMAKETAAYLAKNNVSDSLIAGTIDYAVSPVGAYLNQPIYYFTTSSQGTFINWGPKRKGHPSEMKIGERLETLKKESPSHLPVLLTNQKFKAPNGYALIQEFTGSIVEDENFYIYRPE